MVLSNNRGIISLLDSRGVKVHGISYTREQASHPQHDDCVLMFACKRARLSFL